MKTLITSLLIQLAALFNTDTGAQVMHAPSLVPYRIDGGRLFERNLDFGEFRTKAIRRSLGSFIRTRSIIPGNLLKVDGIPLYHKEKSRSKDKFHFSLMRHKDEAAIVEVDAIMLQNETFNLFKKQDSTFFGAANTDVLLGSIVLTADTSQPWDIAAWNLNASKDEPQRGIITNGITEITFEQTTLLLREPGDQNSTDTLFKGLHMVYAFKINNEVVAAVAFKDMERICWMNPVLSGDNRTAIAGAIAVLRLRRDIYR